MKKNTVVQLIGIALIIAGFGTNVSLLTYFCRGLLEGLLWGISIECLLIAEILFISNNNSGKNKFYKYIYLGIGGGLFIICSFLYLELLQAFQLIIVVSFLSVGFAICCKLLLDKRK